MKVKGKGYDIKAQADDKTAEILIFADIGVSFFGDSVDAKTFAEDLNKLPDSIETINLRINSPGGSVFDGMAIYNSLLKHSARVEVSIDGMAFSIASVIAMAGDTISIAEGAMMMIHNPMSCVCGGSGEMRKVADMMDKAKEGLVKAYTRHVTDSEKAISALMDAETWFTAEEAVEAGFATEVFEAVKIAAHYKGDGVKPYNYKNQPTNEGFIPDVSHEPAAPVADKEEPKEPEKPSEPKATTDLKVINIIEEQKKLLDMI
jgi:ATP-dependent protease ClpP protease subunit